jgi:hypothetical protein
VTGDQVNAVKASHLCYAPLVAAYGKPLVHECSCKGLSSQLVSCKPEGSAEQRKQDATAGNGRDGPARVQTWHKEVSQLVLLLVRPKYCCTLPGRVAVARTTVCLGSCTVDSNQHQQPPSTCRHSFERCMPSLVKGIAKPQQSSPERHKGIPGDCKDACADVVTAEALWRYVNVQLASS